MQRRWDPLHICSSICETYRGSLCWSKYSIFSEMAQGRIKRLQSASRANSYPDKSTELAVCALCDRTIPSALKDAHHLIPKSRGGVDTVFMHRACHKQIHALFTETKLARQYASTQALQAHPEIAKFIQWVQDKPSDFNPPTRRSRSKGRF